LAERGWGELSPESIPRPPYLPELIPPAPFSFGKKKGEAAVSRVFITYRHIYNYIVLQRI